MTDIMGLSGEAVITPDDGERGEGESVGGAMPWWVNSVRLCMDRFRRISVVPLR